jgi:hypothetical protein
MASKGTAKKLNWKGRGKLKLMDLFEVLPQYLLEKVEANHGNLGQDTWCPGRDSSRALFESRSCDNVLAYPIVM